MLFLWVWWGKEEGRRMFKHCEPSFWNMSPLQFQKWAPWGPQWPIPRIKPGFLNTKPAVVNTDNKKKQRKTIHYNIWEEKYLFSQIMATHLQRPQNWKCCIQFSDFHFHFHFWTLQTKFMTEKSLGIKKNLTDLHLVALFLDTGQLLKTETNKFFFYDVNTHFMEYEQSCTPAVLGSP